MLFKLVHLFEYRNDTTVVRIFCSNSSEIWKNKGTGRSVLARCHLVRLILSAKNIFQKLLKMAFGKGKNSSNTEFETSNISIILLYSSLHLCHFEV